MKDLLSGSKKKIFSRKHIPGIHKALIEFLNRKEILLPFQFNDNDKSAISGVSELTNMTGISAIGAASFDEGFVLGDPSPHLKENNETMDEASAQTTITGITL
eukprot:855776-Ditylum_brightwellii.AAC.1